MLHGHILRDELQDLRVDLDLQAQHAQADGSKRADEPEQLLDHVQIAESPTAKRELADNPGAQVVAPGVAPPFACVVTPEEQLSDAALVDLAEHAAGHPVYRPGVEVVVVDQHAVMLG